MFLSACLVLAACGRGEEPAAPAGPPLRVGAYYWPGQYWVDIAHRKGWFAEAGLAIEWVDTNADYFGSFDQLADGSLDIVNMSQFDFLLFNARGKPLVGFLAADYSNGAEALVARPGIDSVRDLAGKRLALAKGTYLEYIWTIIAERHDLDPATVEIVDTPAETAPDALASGAADAFLTWEPIVTKALAGSGGVKLFDTSEVPGISWGVFATRPDLRARREADLHKFTAVWQRTTQFMKERPEEAVAIVAEVNHTSPDEARGFMAIDRILDLRDNIVAFSFAAGFDSLHGSSRRMLDFMQQRGIVTQRPDIPALFDSHFVQELADGTAEK